MNLSFRMVTWYLKILNGGVGHRIIAEDEITLSKNDDIIKHYLIRALEFLE